VSDDIRLTACGRPQLRITDKPCRRCGNPILGVGDLCVACMNRGFRAEILAQQGAMLRDYPAAQLSTARDKLGRRHVGLLGRTDLSFCGLQLTEPKKKRLYFSAIKLPADTCRLCLDLIDKAKEEKQNG
jgi:hypothetical protein